MMIKSDEPEIRGHWQSVDGKVTADENAHRIDALIQKHLKQIGRDATGWDMLYMDPGDGRFWELTYPQSDTHGGGPPLLKCIGNDQAQEKYSHILAGMGT